MNQLHIRRNPANEKKPLFERYPNKMQFLTDCVSCGDGPAINRMKDLATPISYDTFRKRVSISEVSKMLGYSRDSLTLKNDWHVAYFRSFYKGQPCYFLVWSAIEYIYV